MSDLLWFRQIICYVVSQILHRVCLFHLTSIQGNVDIIIKITISIFVLIKRYAYWFLFIIFDTIFLSKLLTYWYHFLETFYSRTHDAFKSLIDSSMYMVNINGMMTPPWLTPFVLEQCSPYLLFHTTLLSWHSYISIFVRIMMSGNFCLYNSSKRRSYLILLWQITYSSKCHIPRSVEAVYVSTIQVP